MRQRHTIIGQAAAKAAASTLARIAHLAPQARSEVLRMSLKMLGADIDQAAYAAALGGMRTGPALQLAYAKLMGEQLEASGLGADWDAIAENIRGVTGLIQETVNAGMDTYQQIHAGPQGTELPVRPPPILVTPAPSVPTWAWGLGAVGLAGVAYTLLANKKKGGK